MFCSFEKIKLQFEPTLKKQKNKKKHLTCSKTAEISLVFFRTVISQLRKDFLSDSPPKPPQQMDQSPPEKKTNKYLKNENRWTGPPPATNGTNGTNGSLIEDTVHSFQAPQIHHAEVVTLRQDTSSESDEDGSNEPPAHMVLQSPMIPMPKSVTSPQKNNGLSLYEQQQQQFVYEQQQLEKKFKEEQEMLKREQEQLMKEQELLFFQQQQQFQQQYFSPQQQQQFVPQPQYTPQPPQFQQSYPPQQSTPKQIPQQVHPRQKGTPSLERSFEDPAYANFQLMGQEEEASSPSTPPTAEVGSPGKKKGFFSGFFKKPSPSTSGSKKSKGGKGKRPRSEYVPEDEDQYEDEQGSELPKSKTDGDLHLRTMARSPVRLSPVVPQPGSKSLNQSALSGIHKNESMVTHPGMSFEQELGYDEDMGESFSDEPLPSQPLQRKLSMSKPTDLDELMRLQEQVQFALDFKQIKT